MHDGDEGYWSLGMLSNVILLVEGYLAPVVAIWAGVVWIRPAVARARVEREVLLIRDRIIDGILNDGIASTNPRALDLIKFCDFVANHSRQLTLPAALITDLALRRSGVDTVAEARTKKEKAVVNSAGLANDNGEQCLSQAEKDVDAAIATYLVRGTAMWWLLVPMEHLMRLLNWWRSSTAHHPTPSEQFSATLKQPFPGELASEVRESARGKDTPSPWWTRGGNVKALTHA
jgi:hypothetical protein